MIREWIALERHEGRGQDLSLYARALHAQLHRWVDGSGRIDAKLGEDLCGTMAQALAFRFGATRGDRRLIAGHLEELVAAGAILLSPDGLELRALADGADLVRHKLAVGDRPQHTKRLKTTEKRTVTTGNEATTNVHDEQRMSNEASRMSNEASRPVTNEQRSVTNDQRSETKSELSARNDSTESPRREEKRIEENRIEEEKSAREALAPSSLELSPTDQPASTAKPKPTRAKRAQTEPTPDPIPEPGTPERKVYDAIVGDAALRPIVRGPGDLSKRLVQLCAQTSVDPTAEVVAAGSWNLREQRWTDGASALLRWVRTAVERAKNLPPIAPGSPTGAVRPQSRTDYRGRVAMASAPLPDASVWETKNDGIDEEDAAWQRIYDRTQPRGRQ